MNRRNKRRPKEYLDSVTAAELGPMRSGTSEQAARARRLDQLLRIQRSDQIRARAALKGGSARS